MPENGHLNGSRQGGGKGYFWTLKMEFPRFPDFGLCRGRGVPRWRARFLKHWEKPPKDFRWHCVQFSFPASHHPSLCLSERTVALPLALGVKWTLRIFWGYCVETTLKERNNAKNKKNLQNALFSLFSVSFQRSKKKTQTLEGKELGPWRYIEGFKQTKVQNLISLVFQGKQLEFRRKRDLYEPLLTAVAQVLLSLKKLGISFGGKWPQKILRGCSRHGRVFLQPREALCAVTAGEIAQNDCQVF